MAILVESCVASARGQQFYSTLWIFRETNPLLGQGFKLHALLTNICLSRHCLPYRDFHIFILWKTEQRSQNHYYSPPPPT